MKIRNHTRCTQEMPVTFKGEKVFVNPFTLILQSEVTLVSCQEGTLSRWNAGRKWI